MEIFSLLDKFDFDWSTQLLWAYYTEWSFICWEYNGDEVQRWSLCPWSSGFVAESDKKEGDMLGSHQFYKDKWITQGCQRAPHEVVTMKNLTRVNQKAKEDFLWLWSEDQDCKRRGWHQTQFSLNKNLRIYIFSVVKEVWEDGEYKKQIVGSFLHINHLLPKSGSSLSIETLITFRPLSNTLLDLRT